MEEELEQQILNCKIGGKRKRKALQVLRSKNFRPNDSLIGFVDQILWHTTPLRSNFWARLNKYHHPNEQCRY